MTNAAPVQLRCPRCHIPWPEAPEQLAALNRCPQCETDTRVAVFPAFSRPPGLGRAADVAVTDNEANCFYHPRKRAHIPCDVCGRFLCALCDLDLNGQHLCPTCLESGAKKGRIRALEHSRLRWDQVVWSVVILPLILCGFVLPVTAVGALVLIALKWNAPGSLVDHTRAALTFAGVVAVIELIAGSAWWWLVFNS